MKFPSKYSTYKESILSKFPLFLETLSICDYSIMELYSKLKSKVSNIQEFMEVLDCLFAMGKITLYEGVIHYVKND